MEPTYSLTCSGPRNIIIICCSAHLVRPMISQVGLDRLAPVLSAVALHAGLIHHWCGNVGISGRSLQDYDLEFVQSIFSIWAIVVEPGKLW
jgi:hypothetical protein